MQRILEAERVLIEAVGPLEPTDEEKRHHRQRQKRGQRTDGGQDEEDGEEAAPGGRDNSGEGGYCPADFSLAGKNAQNETHDGESGGDAQKQQNVRRASPSAEEKEHDVSGGVAGDDEVKQDGKDGEGGDLRGTTTAERKDDDDGQLPATTKGGVDREGVTEGCGVADGERGTDGDFDSGDGLLDQVERIREAVAGAEALSICDDLVAVRRATV